MTQHLLAFHCHGCLCCLPWALLLAQSNITDINKEVGGGRSGGLQREKERDLMLWIKHALIVTAEECAYKSTCTWAPFSRATPSTGANSGGHWALMCLSGEQKTETSNVPLERRDSGRSTWKKKESTEVRDLTHIQHVHPVLPIVNQPKWKQTSVEEFARAFSDAWCFTINTKKHTVPLHHAACTGRGLFKASEGLTWRYIFRRQPRFRWAVRLLLWR